MATSTPPPLPCLVVDNGDTAATLYGVSDGEHRPCEAEELRRNRCWATSHGWVLCCNPATLSTFLWNPTGVDDDGGGGKITLPPFTQPPPPPNSQCALSREPTDAGAGRFTVVLVEPSGSYVLWYCHVVVGGGGSSSSSSPSPAAAGWMRHEYDVGGTNVRVVGGHRFVRRSVAGLTACRGRFYYFHTAADYGVLDFSPAPVFGTVPMAAVDMAEKVTAGEAMAKASVHTLEIGGELYMAYIFFHSDDGSRVVDVGVYRMDFRRRRAVRVRSVGDRAIIAGSNVGGWCPAGGETGL
uniref:KIB1-4 beta-propeller domain-containing protein n=1 Tax=Oryza glumipatula TaxID=40148 RepID=A0A0E0A4N1_9ORYZ